MRLTCPNCKAQYEVDDAVIPPAGRDVQCSSCGHTWYQHPVAVTLQMQHAELEDEEDPAPEPAPSAPLATGSEPEAEAAPRIDRTVLEVLRQEAELELDARRRDRPGMESQPELGLDAGAGAALVNHPRPSAGRTTPRPAVAPSRSSLLPDIDELSSTLEPRNAEVETAPEPTPEPPARAREFRRGLSAALLVVLVLLGLYLLAPGLAEMVPALAGPLTGYVALVDSLRQALAGMLAGMLGG